MDFIGKNFKYIKIIFSLRHSSRLVVRDIYTSNQFKNQNHSDRCGCGLNEIKIEKFYLCWNYSTLINDDDRM